MAVREIIVRSDDLDETEPATRVTFGLDGITYEIDLAADNENRLRESLAPFVAKAHRVSSGTKVARPARSRSAASGTATDVRLWAKEQGMPVSERGRIPADVRQAYEAANR